MLLWLILFSHVVFPFSGSDVHQNFLWSVRTFTLEMVQSDSDGFRRRSTLFISPVFGCLVRTWFSMSVLVWRCERGLSDPRLKRTRNQRFWNNPPEKIHLHVDLVLSEPVSSDWCIILSKLRPLNQIARINVDTLRFWNFLVFNFLLCLRSG